MPEISFISHNISEQTYLQGVDVIRENDDLVATGLVIVDQELTSLDLVRIHCVQQDTFP
jgi:hypothetical protein